MSTPICDFVRRYAESNTVRLHMPGHKGYGPLGVERRDITEICGADSLYEANGIIQESERNASYLFGCPTYYSTEGSSLAIRAMIYLAAQHAADIGVRPCIWAARNAHKTFLSALAFSDIEVQWLIPRDQQSYLSCSVNADELSIALAHTSQRPVAVYLTSPDYLGNVADIRSIAEVCHRYGVLLLVDGAHGAYMRFLPRDLHPITLGADLCCTSAHKTLPVLTGGAYLHISGSASASFCAGAKSALALFGSTSPSYLILQSLDAANPYLMHEYSAHLASLIDRTALMRKRLTESGYRLVGDEPLKLTIATKPYGYHGTALAELLRAQRIECEFSDPDFCVMMLSPSLDGATVSRLEEVLLSIPRLAPINIESPGFSMPEQVMSVRQALLAPCETVAAKDSIGRILAAPCVSCPPAVPIVMSGERIDEQSVRCMQYYGTDTCCVVKK